MCVIIFLEGDVVVFNHLNVDYLKISQEALMAKTLDSEVINATVGVFLNDYKNLYGFLSVSETIKNLEQDKIRSYMNTDGGKEFKENVISYLLGDDKNIFDDIYIETNWSSGASGAIYLAMSYFKGRTILLPNSRWSNYDNTCKVLNKNIIEYNLIKDNHFDLNNISQTFSKTTEKEVMILLNDPAHNPTGYNMSRKEYEKLFFVLNENKHLKISVLIDLAYIDYSSSDYRKEIMPLFKSLEEHVDVYFAFSGSKAFGVYGFRLGALVQLTKSSFRSSDFKKIVYNTSSGIYGPPTSIGIVFFNEIIKNKNVFADREKAFQVLKKRSNALIKELKEYQIDYYPYYDGFFITIKTQEPLKMQELLKKEKCFVVPTYNGLRIAISAIDETEIRRLAKILNKIIKRER